MKTLNLVGCGRVGRTLARLWHSGGVCIVQDVLTRSPASAAEAVAFVGAGRAVEAPGAMRAADLWLFAVSDAAISQAAQAVAAAAAPPAARAAAAPVAFHCSGFLASDALAALRPLGWRLASAHPALSFAAPARAMAQFAGTPCGLEGDAAAVADLERMFSAIGGACFALAAADKPLYHAAAVFASNFLPVLAAAAQGLWRQAGVPPEVLPRLSDALLRHVCDNVLALGPAAALTGPAARGDLAVVQAQAQAVNRWDAATGEAYRALSTLAQRLARDGRAAPAAGSGAQD